MREIRTVEDVFAYGPLTRRELHFVLAALEHRAGREMEPSRKQELERKAGLVREALAPYNARYRPR